MTTNLHLLPRSNEWSYTSTHSIRLHGVKKNKNRDNFTFTFTFTSSYPTIREKGGTNTKREVRWSIQLEHNVQQCSPSQKSVTNNLTLFQKIKDRQFYFSPKRTTQWPSVNHNPVHHHEDFHFPKHNNFTCRLSPPHTHTHTHARARVKCCFIRKKKKV